MTHAVDVKPPTVSAAAASTQQPYQRQTRPQQTSRQEYFNKDLKG